MVCVVDGDGLARESLQRWIGCEGWRCEAFASPQELFALPRAVVPNCLILDASLEGLNALDLQSRLAIDRPITPIIFITARVDLFTAVKAMKAGAIEFLTKPLSPDALLTSIREALERSCVLLAHGAEMQVLRDRYSLLTARERQVMALVVSGLLNKQVGGELGISEITVKAHRGQVIQKMNANSFADLVKKAERLSLAA